MTPSCGNSVDFLYWRYSHPTQADVVASRFPCWTGRRIRFEASSALSSLRPADFLILVRIPKSLLAPPPLVSTPQDHPNAGNQTLRPQSPDGGGTRCIRRRKGGRKRQHHAQAGA